MIEREAQFAIAIEPTMPFFRGQVNSLRDWKRKWFSMNKKEGQNSGSFFHNSTTIKAVNESNPIGDSIHRWYSIQNSKRSIY